MTRDPRTDPHPGDFLACGETLVRVDRVALGEVLVAVFRAWSDHPSGISLVRLSEWAEATREAGVVVLPADDPRQTATILGAP